MSATVEVAFDQHVPLDAARAFELLCDWEDHGRWVPFTRVVAHDEDRFTAYTGIGPLCLEDNMCVSERDPRQRRVRVEKTGPVLTGSAEFSVRPFDDGSCIVRWNETLLVPYAPAWSAPLLRAVTRRLFRRSLRRLPPRP